MKRERKMRLQCHRLWCVRTREYPRTCPSIGAGAGVAAAAESCIKASLLALLMSSPRSLQKKMPSKKQHRSRRRRRRRRKKKKWKNFEE